MADPIETVSMKEYLEIKTKVEALEAQTKTMVKAEDHQAVVAKLTVLETKDAAVVKAANDAANAAKETAVTNRRAELVKKGLPEDKVKTLSEEGLGIAEMFASRKPGADMGSGGGSMVLTGSPMELARQAYANPVVK